MYEVIVVGTDGSDTATTAVEAATALAAALGARLHVVCADDSTRVATSMAAAAGMPVSWDGLEEAALAHTATVLDAAADRARSQGVETVVHACTGAPALSLLEIATDQQADLVVVGNRGMHGARRFLGSVPNHVAHHATCAVMIVPTT